MNIPEESGVGTIKNFIEKNKKNLFEDYYTFLSYPTISSEPEYKQSLVNCADWLKDYLTKMGLETELWKNEGHPIVFATYSNAGPDQPTLLIYNHYDVQPVDPIEEWHSSPFEALQVDGNVYARGAQDNKGQCFYVLQAIKLYLELHGSLPINIKLCIEGEEEMGSANLSKLLDQNRDRLQADYLAIVDLGIRDPKVPAITLGIRGLVALDVELTGSTTDLHSGSNGGIVANPIHALVQLLASLRDEKGRIAIPGFYADVKEMTIEERAQVSFHFDSKEYHRITGAQPFGGEKEFSVLERAWIRPTLEINGIHGGYAGPGVKTVIPAKAFGKISCRLVPGQDPRKIGVLVMKYLQENCPQGVQMKVQLHPGGGKAVRTSPSSIPVKAFSKAFEEVFDIPCEFILEGASIPIVTELAQASGAEVILIGLGLASDQIHAPNEHFSKDRIEKGILIIARALELLAK